MGEFLLTCLVGSDTEHYERLISYNCTYRVFCEMGIPYDQDRVRDIVNTHYPDLRCIANHLDVEFATPAYAVQAHDWLSKRRLGYVLHPDK
jgi:hypothetical protein